ncbi:MAG: glucosidase [Opitutaceae bacterium]|nr:glucosidase [Opitutaceae bacterium]
MTPESVRLDQAGDPATPWKTWGPYVSQRQWGTVREDYSADGNAWDYFPHDHARSRAYRWGEDGLAGVCDDQQRLCLGLALWNGRDPILKERLFGLTNSEGNHGEDVKEYYFFLDSTPTHSYMRMLYKYPHAAFPYDDLVATNRKRTRHEPEYELIDTGVFAEDRYFDVFVEYAKGGPEDVLMRVTVHNRGPEAQELHVLPTLWFRNTWSWSEGVLRPELRAARGGIAARHAELGEMFLQVDAGAALLFTENETNKERLWKLPNRTPYVKDGINSHLVEGRTDTVNPARTGTKAAAHHRITIGPGEAKVVRVRLNRTQPDATRALGNEFDDVFAMRAREADEFYASIRPPGQDDDATLVARQALAGVLWSKQFYYYDVEAWLKDVPEDPAASKERRITRNRDWAHMVNADVISMPDTWEYPWYAAWDLAFHTVALAMVDREFAHQQLDLMLRERYLHPNGQIPAYEWNFGDVNPPVHAWATLFVYSIEKQRTGEGDVNFLKHAFQKLLLNFTWWVNRKDASGRNVFEGGFLGLDNIGVFDRSSPLPTGGRLEQADGTAWMAFFSQGMLEIALELAMHDPVYEDMAMRFLEHFLRIGSAMDRLGENADDMWDEEDGFFYDVLRLPDGHATRLKVRSMVGLLPLCATTVISQDTMKRLPRLVERAQWFLSRNKDLAARIAPPERPSASGLHLLCLLDEAKLRRVLARVLDETEFLSSFGVRSLSRYHADHPYVFHLGRDVFRVDYLPGESDTGMFGGNSNWRGPIWMPVNALIVRALIKLYQYYGDGFTVECPTGSGRQMHLGQVAAEISRRLAALFLRGADGRRPALGAAEVFQKDPHWRDHVLFYEYFHAETGAGIGASHQTGWTSVIAKLLELLAQPATVSGPAPETRARSPRKSKEA